MDPLTLGLSLGWTALDSFNKYRANAAQRREAKKAIEKLDQAKLGLAGQNRAAYSNALSFIAANRNNPNAWNFASSTYNSQIGANTEQARRYTDAQTDLRLGMPTPQTALDFATDLGKGTALSLIYADQFGAGKTGNQVVDWNRYRPNYRSW